MHLRHDMLPISPLLDGGPASMVDAEAGEGQPCTLTPRRTTMTDVATRTRANAVITVHKYEPAAYDQSGEGLVLTRIHVEERFSGDITGDGVVEFLQAARADGSASFVGIERVTGTVAGLAGTFLLQDQGTVEGSVVSGDWFVVPGSGTAGLTGLRGEGGFRANLGEGAQVHLDYWFE
jgi:hypothetical protein